MKICLILHKYSEALDDPCCYPLGYMYVSSYLKAAGHAVKVLNYNLWSYDLKEELKGQGVACFTGFEFFKSRILRDERVCLGMGVRTVVGGPLATFGGIPEFHGAQVVGEIEGPQKIDRVPLPDYEGFGIDEYHRRHMIRYMGVLTTRGCPYSCVFCSQACAFRMRNLGAVFSEIDGYRAKYRPEVIVFNDNTLNINKPRFMRICAEMKSRRVGWGAAIRCQPLDEDMVRAASDSGCKGFVVGVESLIQEKLDRLNKKIKVRQITRAMDLLNKYKVPYHGNILVGFEDETIQDINRELAAVPKIYNLFPAMVQPFVGTGSGHSRQITKDEYNSLNYGFGQYAKSRGKTYSEQEASGCL